MLKFWSFVEVVIYLLEKLITMKKIFLLLSTGFFLTSFAVMGQEQQQHEENNKPEKINVSKSEKATLKSSKNVRAKKVNIITTEAVQRKKITSKELEKPEEQK